jgi:hypothetical protein
MRWCSWVGELVDIKNKCDHRSNNSTDSVDEVGVCGIENMDITNKYEHKSTNKSRQTRAYDLNSFLALSMSDS